MAKRRVASAIPYRVGDTGVEVLLVRTKGGDKWTFPKGHVEKGEDPREAALREAGEEAGISGKIAPEPLAEYDYPHTRRRRGDDRVLAYVLEVTDQRPPRESFREPTWFAPDEALEKLAEGGRERRYVEEHERVLNRALEQIGPPD